MPRLLHYLSLLRALILGPPKAPRPALTAPRPITTLPVIYEEGDEMPKSQDETVNAMVAAARRLLKADTTLHPQSRAVLLQMKAIVGSFDQDQCAQAQALLLQEFPRR